MGGQNSPTRNWTPGYPGQAVDQGKPFWVPTFDPQPFVAKGGHPKSPGSDRRAEGAAGASAGSFPREEICLKKGQGTRPILTHAHLGPRQDAFDCDFMSRPSQSHSPHVALANPSCPSQSPSSQVQSWQNGGSFFPKAVPRPTPAASKLMK